MFTRKVTRLERELAELRTQFETVKTAHDKIVELGPAIGELLNNSARLATLEAVSNHQRETLASLERIVRRGTQTVHDSSNM